MINVGPATAQDLIDLGYRDLDELKGEDPVQMYEKLSNQTGVRQDPCVIDIFMATVHNVETGENRLWWEFTPERKKRDQG